MKIFTSILAIYVLSLSFVTCNDDLSHNHDFGDPINNISENEPHSDESSMDDCSPFCSCQCCQVNLNVQNIEGFDILQPKISTKLFSKSYEVAQEFAYSKFEPPKV